MENMYVNNGQQVGQANEQVKPMNSDSVSTITTLNDLQSYAKGIVVRFPDFADGQPFVARVKRPSMLMLAKQGKIPNTLLTTAGDLFAKGGNGVNTDDEKMMSDMYDIMHIVCESCLVEPSLQEIEASGMALTDEQIMAIFSYTQAGVKALETFRQE